MRKFFFLALMFLSAAVMMKLGAEEPVADQKILIAYFSWSGNTRGVAQKIQQKTGGDIFEIESVEPYPRDYKTCTEQAKREQREQARPALKKQVENLAQYDVIILGYPNWWSSIPMPVASFLEAYDFSGKTIVPFCSSGGGGLGKSLAAIAKLAPRATIAESLAFTTTGGASLANNLAEWLRKNHLPTK